MLELRYAWMEYIIRLWEVTFQAQTTGGNGAAHRLALYGALGVAAWRGREAENTELIQATMDGVASRGEGRGVTTGFRDDPRQRHRPHQRGDRGAALFLSTRTVEWHPSKVYTKLGVGSRRELRQALASFGQADAQA